MKKKFTFNHSNVFSHYWTISYKTKFTVGVGLSWSSFGLGFKIDKYTISWDFLWIYGGVEW